MKIIDFPGARVWGSKPRTKTKNLDLGMETWLRHQRKAILPGGTPSPGRSQVAFLPLLSVTAKEGAEEKYRCSENSLYKYDFIT